MTTIADVQAKLYRKILEPPSAQAPLTTATSVLSIGVLTFQHGNFEIPEDQNLLRLGTLIEADAELMRVTDYDPATSTVTVRRGQEGTTEADHVADVYVKLNVNFPKQDAFDSIRNNITRLAPMLYTVRTLLVGAVQGNVFPIEDPLLTSVISVSSDSGLTGDLDGQITDYHRLTDGRALVLNTMAGGSVWLKAKRRMGVATALTDTLDDLGVEQVWEDAVVFGAAADMLAGRDVPEVNTEWIESVLEAEGIRVGQRLSISAGLLQYRDALVESFAKEMKEDAYRTGVHMNDPFAQIVR